MYVNLLNVKKLCKIRIKKNILEKVLNYYYCQLPKITTFSFVGTITTKNIKSINTNDVIYTRRQSNRLFILLFIYNK